MPSAAMDRYRAAGSVGCAGRRRKVNQLLAATVVLVIIVVIVIIGAHKAGFAGDASVGEVQLDANFNALAEVDREILKIEF